MDDRTLAVPTDARREGSRAAASSKLHGRMLFLVGARRSGTNFLQRVLTAHPRVAALPAETYLFAEGFQKLSDNLQHLAPGLKRTAKTYVARDTFNAAVRDFADRIFLENLAFVNRDARYLLERTPWHALHLPLIAAAYPDARVIHIVRDGRAVARSLVSMDWGPATIEEAATEWGDCVRGGLGGKALFGANYREVRFEALMSAPLEGARALYDWLGLPAADVSEDKLSIEASTKFNVDPRSPEIVADKWRDALSAEDLAAFDRTAGELVAELGYPRTVAGQRRKSVASGPAQSDGRGAVRKLASRLRRSLNRPKPELDRRLARHRRNEMRNNLGVVERFEELVDAGNHAEARRLCAREARFAFSCDATRIEGQGDEPYAGLVDALGEHASAVRTDVLVRPQFSASMFTRVYTYGLADGSRWSETRVITARSKLITAVSAYRFKLQTG